MRTVARHRACRGCGYDLFSLPADGVCPECSRGIGGGRKPHKLKNLRRVAGQLRRMVVQSNRDTYLVAAFWFVPLLGLAACWWFGARWWVWGIVTLSFVSGVIQHLTERSKRHDWAQRLAEIDGNRDAG